MNQTASPSCASPSSSAFFTFLDLSCSAWFFFHLYHTRLAFAFLRLLRARLLTSPVVRRPSLCGRRNNDLTVLFFLFGFSVSVFVFFFGSNLHGTHERKKNNEIKIISFYNTRRLNSNCRSPQCAAPNSQPLLKSKLSPPRNTIHSRYVFFCFFVVRLERSKLKKSLKHQSSLLALALRCPMQFIETPYQLVGTDNDCDSPSSSLLLSIVRFSH